jgi:butyryl-CoA dehydrogenase
MAASSALQCFGGYGYCEDFPVEQYLRDIRIQAIHEGTTGIQGMDLLGRKLVMKNGRAGILFLKELDHTIQAAQPFPGLAHGVKSLTDAKKLLESVADVLFQMAGQGKIDAFLADATLFLEFFGLIVIAWQWLLQGIAAEKALAASPSTKEERFYRGKQYAMHYFFRYELPRIHGLCVRLMDGDHLTLDMDPAYLTDY